MTLRQSLLPFLTSLILCPASAFPQGLAGFIESQASSEISCTRDSAEKTEAEWSGRLLSLTKDLNSRGARSEIRFQNPTTWTSLCRRGQLGEWERFASRFARAQNALLKTAEFWEMDSNAFKDLTIIWTDEASCKDMCHSAGWFAPEQKQLIARIDSLDPAATLHHELIHHLHQQLLPRWFDRKFHGRHLTWMIEMLAIATTDAALPLPTFTPAETVFWEGRRQGSLADLATENTAAVAHWYGFTTAFYRYLKSHLPGFQKYLLHQAKRWAKEEGATPPTAITGLPTLSGGLHPLAVSSPKGLLAPEEFQNWPSLFTHFVVSLFSKAHHDPYLLTTSGSTLELHLRAKKSPPIPIAPGECARVPAFGFIELSWLETDLKEHQWAQESGVTTLFWKDHRGSPSSFLTAPVQTVRLTALANDQSSRFVAINTAASPKKVCLK